MMLQHYIQALDHINMWLSTGIRCCFNDDEITTHKTAVQVANKTMTCVKRNSLAISYFCTWLVGFAEYAVDLRSTFPLVS